MCKAREIRGQSGALFCTDNSKVQAACSGLHTVVADYNWNRHGRIVDIGAAYGSFLASILTKHPKPRGVLFDQSQAS